jgi:hypothetical protein
LSNPGSENAKTATEAQEMVITMNTMLALTRRAVNDYGTIVESFACVQLKAVRHIEHSLNGMLSFCFEPEALPIYREALGSLRRNRLLHHCGVHPCLWRDMGFQARYCRRAPSVG